MFHFENSVDPDQLASEKPADQDPHSIISTLIVQCKYTLMEEEEWSRNWLMRILAKIRKSYAVHCKR